MVVILLFGVKLMPFNVLHKLASRMRGVGRHAISVQLMLQGYIMVFIICQNRYMGKGEGFCRNNRVCPLSESDR